MDFAAVVLKHGEETCKAALVRLVGRIRGIIHARTGAAVNGVLVLTAQQLQEDALSVASVLEDFPFSVEEKLAVINKAWEIVGP